MCTAEQYVKNKTRQDKLVYVKIQESFVASITIYTVYHILKHCFSQAQHGALQNSNIIAKNKKTEDTFYIQQQCLAVTTLKKWANRATEGRCASAGF